jgi:hypothetical protein
MLRESSSGDSIESAGWRVNMKNCGYWLATPDGWSDGGLLVDGLSRANLFRSPGT